MTQTYTETFTQLVTDIISNVKERKTHELLRFMYDGLFYDLAARKQRMALIEHVTDDYVLAHADVNQAALDTWIERGCKGERPSPIPLDAALIDRLTDVVLDEELTDTTSWKTRHTEYPFLSELQMARRTDGTHQRKFEGDSGEAKLSAAQNYGTDGRSYNVPLRRERSNNENTFMDAQVRTRNKERRAAYEEFTRERPVITRKATPEEREARGWDVN